MHGWMGRILHVDLNNAAITEFSTQPYAEKYLGGRGIASRLYWERVKPETRAFDPENRLIFVTGPLVATGAQGATRMSVVGKSPMAYPEGYCYGNIGGFFAAELKRAGWDGIVITGRSPDPVYLYINNDKVELRDASSLWGNGAYRVEEMLRQVHGEKARFLTTGIAGENLIRSAVIFGSHQSTATAGFGAVMGSKKLKAIVVKGTGKPSVADPDKLTELNRYTVKISQRVHLAVPPLITATQHGHLLEVRSKGGCDRCGIACIRNLYRYGQRLEGYRRCQAMEYYLPWRYGLDDEPVDTLFDAPTLANDYSIGTFELQSIIDWLYACFKSGVLTDEETGLPLSRIGTREFLEKLLHSIAYREGFGGILADGLVRAGEKVSAQARKMFSHTIAPVGQQDLAPPRAIVAHALIYPMEPRIHQPLIHEISFVNAAWSINLMQPGSTGVTTGVFHEIAKAFWGSEAAGDLSSYEGKALAAQKIQNRTYTKDSLGLCDFAWPITYSFATPDHVGDPTLEAKLFTAVTGADAGELAPCAERIASVQRAIMVREGHRVPEDDFPPEFNFTEPLGSGPRGGKVMVPGPRDEAVDATGNVLDRDKFSGMLREYYRLRGWDEETGLPRADTLNNLGLEDLLPSFQH
ncbi:MAG TPA: aldehyde ferredoxin oxidoreductase N-terminal domain-containing protein [Dehalococcoidales bacterium]|nr:aldehyde ferredoxin oxidoreductase N-terminal domain-containing protein [Dehalococcoidales bacterium]